MLITAFCPPKGGKVGVEAVFRTCPLGEMDLPGTTRSWQSQRLRPLGDVYKERGRLPPCHQHTVPVSPPSLSLSSPELSPGGSGRSPPDALGCCPRLLAVPGFASRRRGMPAGRPSRGSGPGSCPSLCPGASLPAWRRREEAGGPPARWYSPGVTMETIFFFSIPPFADDSGDEEPASQSDKSELHGTLKTLSSKLEDLSTCNDLIAKHGAALQRSLSELENLKLPAESGEKIKAVNERATLFRITSNAMINVSTAAVASRQGEAFSPPPPLPLPFPSGMGADPLGVAETLHSAGPAPAAPGLDAERGKAEVWGAGGFLATAGSGFQAGTAIQSLLQVRSHVPLSLAPSPLSVKPCSSLCATQGLKPVVFTGCMVPGCALPEPPAGAGRCSRPCAAPPGFPPAFGRLLVGRGARGAASVGANQPLPGALASLGRGGEGRRERNEIKN